MAFTTSFHNPFGPASNTTTLLNPGAMQIAISMSTEASTVPSGSVVTGIPVNPSNRTTWMGTFGSPAIVS